MNEPHIPGGKDPNPPIIEPDETISFKRNHLYAVLLPIAFLTGLALGYMFWGRTPNSQPQAVTVSGSGPATAESPQSASPADDQPRQVRRYDVPIDDDPIIGPENAPITIIEFSDYECPYCQKWHQETYDKLLETYPDQVRFVYRDFPLESIHPDAEPAAEAANCANEQNAFWKYHDLLFDRPNGLGREAYIGYASSLGLDTAAFTECLDSGRYKEEVQADLSFAVNLGVQSTPTFFINGIPLVGAQPFEVFQQVIDLEQAGKLSK